MAEEKKGGGGGGDTLDGYTYTAPRVHSEIACPMTSSVYVFVGIWLFQSIVYFFTCWAYSTIIISGE
ncbi:hypothetical protein, conserved [Eimeria maxima]|uniref:Uncharacterized protein n=1 Tax=Eimeria maxima TaxID=5804 RepID=U6M585_EIMMA|nr:hypothetical protein, conserved [Eimeria maxima]CDJ56840.1 hypothetical protein, conserved [Eimeria maxima]